MRFLAIDPGGRRVGFALGDETTGVVTPLTVIPYTGVEGCAHEIENIAAAHSADAIVIGFPTSEDGQRTSACARSEALARALVTRGMTIHEQGEFLTTNEARRRAAEAGYPAKRPIDHFAALVLLEEFLENRQS